ncbi:hypothetical protein, partial [Deinococcus ruber]|uniref:hypothetical protein n=1 Tax=Deinococcus ruber TaxID=1848197 RepID=UPI001662D55A
KLQRDLIEAHAEYRRSREAADALRHKGRSIYGRLAQLLDLPSTNTLPLSKMSREDAERVETHYAYWRLSDDAKPDLMNAPPVLSNNAQEDRERHAARWRSLLEQMAEWPSIHVPNEVI